MYRLLHLYNQNRLKVWIIIFAIILGWLMLKVVNNAIKEKRLSEQNIQQETTSNVVSYYNESESIISEGRISSKYSEDLGNIITQFFTYCIEHQPEYAYTMLTDDIKKELYPTLDVFIELYYKNKFDGDKQFSFQSWTTADKLYIYQVKIYDNMLSTGKTNDNYIEDFVVVIPDEGGYKISVNGYLGETAINKISENDILTIEVATVDRYMDYEIYILRIKNKINERVLLDTRRNTNTCYIQDSLGNRFEALLYENNDEDLILNANESKTIKIKFNDSYRENMELDKIVFEDIVRESEYNLDTQLKGDSIEAVINE